MFQLIEFQIFSILIILTLILVGRILNANFRNTKKHYSSWTLFKDVFVGVIFIITFSSILFTKFITVNVFILPIAAFFIIKNYNSEIRIKVNFNFIKQLLNQTFLCYLIYLIFFFHEVWYFYDFDQKMFVIPHFDFNMYANFGSSIIEFGRENKDRFLNSLFPNIYNGITPYHYIELWFNGTLQYMFNVSPIKVLMLITYPILKMIVFLGFLSLFEFFSNKRILKYLIVSILLGWSGVYLVFYEKFELTKYFIGFTQTGVLSFGRKYTPLYIGSLFSIIFFLRKEYKRSIVSLFLLPIFSIGTAPAVLTIINLLSLLISKKTKSYMFFIGTLTFSIMFMVFIKYVSIDSSQGFINESLIINKLISNPLNIDNLKILIFSFIFPYFRFFLTHSCYILILIFGLIVSKGKFKSPQFKLTLISLTLVTIGCFYGALCFGMLNSGQLLYNNLPLINVIFITAILISFKNHKYLKLIISLVSIISIWNFINFHNKLSSSVPEIYNNHSKSFRNECVEILNQEPMRQAIGYSLNDIGYKEGGIGAYFKIPCFFLGLSKKGTYYIDINAFRLNEFTISEYDKYYTSNYELNLYNKYYGHDKSLLDVTTEFIKTCKLKFLYIQNGSNLIDGLLNNLKINKVVIDELTGDKFIILK